MRKGMWLAAAALVVLLSGAGVVEGTRRVLAADGQVKIDDADSNALKWRFDPVDVTVPAGATVMWHNAGVQVHTVTADDKSFDSKDVKPGDDFQFKFATPGDFAYHCTPHDWMKGVVHVTGGSAPTTAAPTTTTTAAQPGASTTTTTAKAGASTTTTTKAGAAGESTTTTAAPVTSTTVASSATPTSAPDSAGVTSTTVPPSGEEGAAAGSHGSSGGGKSSPIGIAFASVMTLLLGAISLKLLAAKS